MRWDEGHESPDVIDRRGAGGAGFGWLPLVPLLIRRPMGVVLLLVLAAGSFVVSTMRSNTETPQVTETTGATGVVKDAKRHFVSFVLDDTQETWQGLFAKSGRPYRRAKLVLFNDATSTGCGSGDAATGPFYCPNDERVYIDLSFYDELAKRFGSKGDFAQAYVIAHEIGHHVQKQLGTSAIARGLRRSEREGATGASVRLELQADCFAGVWAHSTQTRALLDPGDVDEALGAAAAIGDDRLQRESRGVVSPETFTHGTSAQRSRWFRTGLERGEVDGCDTLQAPTL